MREKKISRKKRTQRPSVFSKSVGPDILRDGSFGTIEVCFIFKVVDDVDADALILVLNVFSDVFVKGFLMNICCRTIQFSGMISYRSVSLERRNSSIVICPPKTSRNCLGGAMGTRGDVDFVISRQSWKMAMPRFPVAENFRLSCAYLEIHAKLQNVPHTI